MFLRYKIAKRICRLFRKICSCKAFSEAFSFELNSLRELLPARFDLKFCFLLDRNIAFGFGCDTDLSQSFSRMINVHSIYIKIINLILILPRVKLLNLLGIYSLRLSK